MAATAASTTAQSSAPIVHAIGGSIGSALAVLLFYPIERARIDIQSQASAITPSSPSSSSNNNANDFHSLASEQDNDLESVHAKLVVDTTQQQEEEQTNETNDKSGVQSTTSSWTSLEEQRGKKKDPSSTFLPHKTFTTKKTTKSTDSPSWSMDSSSSSSSSSSVDSSILVDNNNNDAAAISTLQEKRKQITHKLLLIVSKKSVLLRTLVDLHSRGELYHGVTPIISTIFTSQFIFFFVHAYIKRLLQSTRYFTTSKGGITGNSNASSSSSALLSLSSSCIAGIGNVLLTNPLWVTNMAIVTGETKTQNLLRELIQLWKQYGIRHLWDGTSASILLVSNPIIQFFCYEQMKHARLHAKGTNQVHPIEAFFIAALAKGIATLTTYPLQLAQTLLRIGNSNSSDDEDNKHGHQKQHQQHQHYEGTIDCLIQLYKRNKSFAAWFTGIRAKLLQTVLTAAFTFLTYEQILGAVQTVLTIRAADHHNRKTTTKVGATSTTSTT